MSPRGRRPAGSDTRGEIVEAARGEFAERGYAAASLRSIARRAGVDPALVHHYFDGKEALFGEAMALSDSPVVLLGRIQAAPRTEIGRMVAESFFHLWDAPADRERLRALFSAVLTDEHVARMLREFLANVVFTRVVTHADGSPVPSRLAEFRGGLAAGQVLGIGVLRYVLGYPAIAEASVPELVDAIAPVLQAHLVLESPVRESGAGG